MPEQDLWQAVLRLAVDDALLGPSQPINRDAFIIECRQARAFLTTASDDLAVVCSNAGLDPRAVLERIRDLIANAPTPEELHDQPRQRRDAVAKAATKPKAVPFKDQLYTFNGTTRTAAEWCERTGISLDTARNRLSLAWGPERAFTLTKADALQERKAEARASYRATTQRTDQTRRKRAPNASAPRYEHNGESLTLAEWSDRVRVKKNTLRKRLASGWSIGEALTNRDTRHKRLAKVS